MGATWLWCMHQELFACFVAHLLFSARKKDGVWAFFGGTKDSEAREQCWITLENLRSHVSCAAKEVTVSVRKRKEKANEGVNLFGEQAEGASTSLVVLVVGLVTYLVICTGESKPRDADAFSKVVSLIEQLELWLR
eukprot:Gb_17741 [translate_table: standard]